MATTASPFGPHLRYWRERHRLTQAELAFSANVSPRHLSFVETGRAAPSRELVQVLAERLNLSLGDRNALLLSAGFAPVFDSRPLGDTSLEAARRLLDEVLIAHEPNPTLAFDRHWNLVAANRMVAVFLQGVAAELLEPPVNLLRLTLHPRGLAPRIENLPHWREVMLTRLRRRQAETGDRSLMELYGEVSAYPPGEASTGPHNIAPTFAAPFRLTSSAGSLAFLSTTVVFGTPHAVELPQLAVETFLPADQATTAALQKMAAGGVLTG